MKLFSRKIKKDLKVTVIGLGQIGFPVAKHISKYYPTVGHDVSQEAVAQALSKGVKATAVFSASDVYIIAVNTWFRNGSPDMSAIDNCCQKIASMNHDALVCFESTLAMGTARHLAIKHDLKKVAVCPHRWWKEDQIKHGVAQTRVLGAIDLDCLKQAVSFYESLDIPIHQVSSLEIAETVKIVENSHRFIQIAFAEELRQMAEANKLSFDELRQACNTKWNCEILEARDGIGRECLPKDIRYLLELHQEASLVLGAIKADENYVQVLKAKTIALPYRSSVIQTEDKKT
jgi:nucleotide sugar dehydrogenase